MSEPSQHMLEVYASGVGSPQIECICGRVHFAPDSMHMDREERNELKKLVIEKPDKYIAYPRDDSVSAAMINGNPVVRDCPCEWFQRFERLIWNERENILRYYRVRRDAETAVLSTLDAQLSLVAERKAKR